MIGRALGAAAALLLAGGAGWVLTAPDPLPDALAAGPPGDPGRGALVFAAAGCASCHVAPEAEIGEAPVLAGGRAFVSPFGTFLAPNISPSPQGVGDWSDAEIMGAVMRGVSPSGAHYYPALPYAAYAKADPQDMRDLVAHLRTLPPSSARSLPHDVPFPFSIRRGIGLWKRLNLDEGWVVAGDLSKAATRGRYIAEALSHCGECHTPRGALGGLDHARWLSGAPNPSGEGRIPDITPAGLDWSESDIAYYLETGFTPDFDTAGAEMAMVVSELAKLPAEDRAAIAAYLKSVPPVE
ncbi:cytochrome c [Limimaricola hongkongensis]|uniref:Putative diheme cytochrome c-553 n=1 Tax=Limimaricola hongkongensis DSM 17492 TaxID=1122180 RepID=A0A017HDP4_9RHOB|nr:cytochrome c [Limimaricola hongkongensis]EYD71914.1 Putative diheme cytochrome c-553 [Limimaricola hongkongensis DSM 17492]